MNAESIKRRTKSFKREPASLTPMTTPCSFCKNNLVDSFETFLISELSYLRDPDDMSTYSTGDGYIVSATWYGCYDDEEEYDEYDDPPNYDDIELCFLTPNDHPDRIELIIRQGDEDIRNEVFPLSDAEIGSIQDCLEEHI